MKMANFGVETELMGRKASKLDCQQMLELCQRRRTSLHCAFTARDMPTNHWVRLSDIVAQANQTIF